MFERGDEGAETLSSKLLINYFKSIENDDEGMDLAKLEEAIKTEPNVKMLYLIPTFQNPSGRTMSYERRKAIYELCVKHEIIILEDNPYGELRYKGEYLPWDAEINWKN